MPSCAEGQIDDKVPFKREAQFAFDGGRMTPGDCAEEPQVENDEDEAEEDEEEEHGEEEERNAKSPAPTLPSCNGEDARVLGICTGSLGPSRALPFAEASNTSRRAWHELSRMPVFVVIF
jgi:hypothetical protein